MNEPPAGRLTGEQIMALRFAAHRQLARWSNKPKLTPHQLSQRTALRRAVHILDPDAFTNGCELRPHNADGANGA